jgi:predicted ribosome quality control (RQC) complex YloA/Tae2 family protein
MKKEMSSVDVAAIVLEFNTGSPTLIDAKIGKIYQINDDEIRMTLKIYGQGRHHLIIQAGKRIHLTRCLQPAPKLPGAFPMFLRKYISGGRIRRISQYDFDRIIEFEIIRAGVITRLIAEFFAKGNIILTDDESRILQPLKPVSFKDRKLRKGEKYELPPQQISPFEITAGSIAEVLGRSERDVVRTLAAKLNIGGVLAEEVCLRADIDKHTPAREISDPGALQKAVNETLNPIIEGKLKPQIIIKNTERIDVLPFGLNRYQGFDIQEYEHFSKALDIFFNTGIKKITPEKIKITKQEDMLKRRLRQQHEAIEKFSSQEMQLKKKGELLYGNYQTVNEILMIINKARQQFAWDEIKTRLNNTDIHQAKIIQSIDSGKGILTLVLDDMSIEVNIKLTVPQNAQIYYDRAKKILKKKTGAQNAILQTEKLIKKSEKSPEQNHFKYTARNVRVKPRWYDRFRWFESSDGFLVVGGRDAGTNEEIVKKYMEKRDIFFHTESPGSPAVIIKTEGKQVPQTTLKETAQFVVTNSEIWKSGRVEGDCYWVTPEQVSKTPEPGEFVPRGSFIIRGKRNYLKAIVGAAVGIRTEGTVGLVGGPPEAVRRLSEYVIEIEPGEFNQGDTAMKIYKILIDKVGNRQFVKSIASADKIAMMLPPGNSNIRISR